MTNIKIGDTYENIYTNSFVKILDVGYYGDIITFRDRGRKTSTNIGNFLNHYAYTEVRV